MAQPSIDLTEIDRRATNLATMFLDRVEASSGHTAYRFPSSDNTWTTLSWGEVGSRVQNLAAGLLALGITTEQRIGIASNTRVEWVLADLATMCAGAATTTVYPTTISTDVAYVLADSQTRIVFAEDDEQVSKIKAHRAELPELFKVIVFDGTTDSDWIIDLADLESLGKNYLREHPDAIYRSVESIHSDQLATLIYTSGTTGPPKGVRLTHDSWTYQGAVTRSYQLLSESDVQLLWLPLAHSFGKVLLSAQLACGFTTAIDGRVDRIIDNLAVVNPTFLGAVPRIFEKVYARITTAQTSSGWLQRRIFDMAFEVGKQVDDLKRNGQRVPAYMRFLHQVSDRMVFRRIRDKFGRNLRFMLSGSAALNPEIARWFHIAGILILEGYGLTETSAVSFVNHPDHYKIGTVGTVYPGSEVRIGLGDEIQLRGPHVMDGYQNLPEETAATLTEDGWLRTGDKGQLDADGFLTITGRIKELFKTSGGKYVAPPAIEAKFKALCPYVSQFMVFGEDRKYCIALVTLDPDAIAAWASNNGLTDRSYHELTQSSLARQLIDEYITELNIHLNQWETIKRFAILNNDLSVESGELTPSLKVRRNVIQTNHEKTIDSLYT